MFQHILVPLDGSALAEAALPVAASLAKTLDASITLIHVIEKNAPQAVHGEHHLTDPDEACSYLDRLAREAFPPGVQVDQHVHTSEVSNVARSIVDHVGEFAPDLIVMCSHGSGGLRDILVGNIAQQVIAQGKRPVLLIHPLSDTPVPFQCKQILVPMDGKPAHEHGLGIAAGLGSAYHAILTLLFVVPTLGTLGGHQAATGLLLPGTMSALLDMNEQAAEDYLEAQGQRVRASELQIDQVVVRGDPTPTIADFAGKLPADLIVLGTHGKAGAGAFWAGSVAPKLAGLTAIPLLFVPVQPSKTEG
jgi:nucleotide-binding universal stress UspA family protein